MECKDSKLLHTRFIPVPVELAAKFRAALKTRASDAAIFLQQLHYWMTKGQGVLHKGKRWIWNSYKDWQENFPWLSDWDFRIITSYLRQHKLILFAQLSQDKRDRTGYYTLNYEHEWLAALSPESEWQFNPDASEDTTTDAPDGSSTDNICTKDYQTNQNTRRQKRQNVVSSSKRVVLEKTSTQEQSVVSEQLCVVKSGETVPKTPARLQLPETQELKESQKQTEIQEQVELPQQQKLESHRVNVQDKGLQAIALKYRDRLATAVAAWLEWAARTSVEKPTRSLAQAIKEDWQPESKVLSPQEKAAAVVEETDWTTHPEWESWLKQMRQGIPKFVVFGTSFDHQVRKAIADWANARQLIWEPIGVR